MIIKLKQRNNNLLIKFQTETCKNRKIKTSVNQCFLCQIKTCKIRKIKYIHNIKEILHLHKTLMTVKYNNQCSQNKNKIKNKKIYKK